jgi:hypothetical protein
MGRRSLLDSHFIEFASIVLFYAAAVSHRSFLMWRPPSRPPDTAASVPSLRGCLRCAFPRLCGISLVPSLFSFPDRSFSFEFF